MQHIVFVVLACGCLVLSRCSKKHKFYLDWQYALKWSALFILVFGMISYSLIPQVSGYLSNIEIGHVRGGLGYKNWKANGSNNTQNIFTTSASAGLREMTSNSVSLDYGVLGNYCFANGSSLTVNPYSLGGYVGVDYTATKNMLLTARVVAYNYSRGADKTKYNNFFHAGTVSISYMFS